jgi:two-component system, NarL family, nitrate/nitrite response regulator NarL
MLNDQTIKHLQVALKHLKDEQQSTSCWPALKPLAALGDMDTRFTIDLQATHQLGAPVIVARPGRSADKLFAPLTPRQRQVANLIVAGHPNKQIARALGIKLGTVKDHVHAILTRLGFSSRGALMSAVLDTKDDG